MATFKQRFNKKYKQPLAKSNSLKDIAKLTGYKLSGLQKVYNKGIGAAKTAGISRPQVKSKEAWAAARVYAAVSKGSKTYKLDKNLLIKKKKK